jgi:ABC-type branched-subunit amino acid transport system substrate-binding protein
MVLSDGNLTDDSALKSMGDVALGFVTVAHYDWNHASALNREFVRDYAEISGGRHPDVLSIGSWDGMHLIYEALKKNWRQDGWRQPHQRGEGHGLGKPAWAHHNRRGDARHHPGCLHSPSRKGRW